mgnify:FL=1
MTNTGSDTRMYAPRSESNLGWTKDDDDYKHGYGDPEQMEITRDKKQEEQAKTSMTEDLPHLQISIADPEPPMPPAMGEEEEEEPPEMDDQFKEGQQFGAQTGMPDTGNLSIGAATGTMPAPGGMLATGEPMNDAWSSLMKSKLDDMGSAKPKSWKQGQFEIQPGGSQIETANTRRAKRVSRNISPSKKTGIDQAPLSVHRTHLGISTKQPLRLFPRAYGQQQATQSRRKLMGNVPNMPAGHGIGAESDYNPKSPSIASTQGLQMKEPRSPMMRGQSFGKSEELALIKKDIEEIRKKQNYMQFTQMRRLVRQLKEALERRESSKKASTTGGPGNKGGHMEANNKTTRPTGPTEDLNNIPESWGAPATLFAAKGSGRVG